MTLRLADLEAPLDDVEFPNGTKHQPVPFGPTEYKLWREAREETDSAKQDAAMLRILRACYPTATDDDFNTCTVRMFAAMIAHAMRRITTAQDAVKNDDGEGTGGVAATLAPKPSPTTDSSPNPNGNTSSRSTRKRSGKTRGASVTASPTDGPSSSGTGTTTLKNPDASTSYAVNWTTSTELPSRASA